MTKNRDKRLGVMTKISLKKLIFRILRGAWSKFLFCIENAKMKKLKTSVSEETLSAETDVFENAKIFSRKQIKNFDRQKTFFTKILEVIFYLVCKLKIAKKSQTFHIFLYTVNIFKWGKVKA